MKTPDNDFATFVQTNWSLVEPSKLIWTPHMQIICDAFQDVVEGKNNRLIVNVPHGTSKSLLAAVFLPAWIQKTNVGRVGIVSDGIDLARRDYLRSQQVTRENWPNQGALGSLDWFSVDGRATAQRFDMLILDVSNGPRKGKGWVDAVEIVWKTRLYDPKKSKVILIETRPEYGDVTGRLLRDGDWRHICLPMAYDPKVAKEDFRTEEGQLLCPERWDRELLDGYRLALGEVGFNAQYQQNPPLQPEAVKGISVNPMYPNDYARHIADVAKRYKQGDLSVKPDVRKMDSGANTFQEPQMFDEVTIFVLVDNKNGTRSTVACDATRQRFADFLTKHKVRYTEVYSLDFGFRLDIEFCPGSVYVTIKQEVDGLRGVAVVPDGCDSSYANVIVQVRILGML